MRQRQPRPRLSSFMVRRAGGDWGEEAASHTARHLANLARDIPQAVVEHVDGMLGAILALCAPESGRPVLRRSKARLRWSRRWNVNPCGSVATLLVGIWLRPSVDAPPPTLSGCSTSVQALFSATTGDESQDRAVRTTMLDVLEEAVSPQTLRDILPVTYTALLHRDQSVRSGGIDLWVCLRSRRRLAAGRAERAGDPAPSGSLTSSSTSGCWSRCASSLSRRTSCPSCCRLS